MHDLKGTVFIKKSINDGRNAAYGAVNSVMIRTNWAIGKRIVEQEQAGADRAEYGTRVIQLLSEELTSYIQISTPLQNCRSRDWACSLTTLLRRR